MELQTLMLVHIAAFSGIFSLLWLIVLWQLLAEIEVV